MVSSMRAGRAGAWLRKAASFAAILSIIVALSSATANVGGRATPLDYHATVMNGRVTGSSFVIDEGIAVTNAHVLNGRKPGETVRLVVPGTGGRRTDAVVLAVSPRMDLALLRVNDGFLPVAPSAVRVRRGGALVAAGVVAGSGGPGQRMTVSGQVTSARRHLAPFGTGVIARMPGIRRGFSGGPVFDRNGRLVGMVAALRPETGPSAGRDAFVLTAEDIHAEKRRLLRSL